MECIKHGALDYLVKPFRIDDLEAVVQKALDQLDPEKAAGTAPKPEAAGGLGLEFIIGEVPP